MTKKSDPREHCRDCASLYGLENPKMKAVRNDRYFIALTGDNPDKPSMIKVIPKTHMDKYFDLARDHEMSICAASFIGLVMLHCRKKLGAKQFRLSWVDGSHKIRVSQPYAHIKYHLHANLEVIYS